VFVGALSHVFQGTLCETSEMICVALVESIPLVYSSIEEHQKGDYVCKELSQNL